MSLSENRKRISVASIAILLMIIAVIWYCWPNNRVAAVRQLRAQLTGEAGRQLTPAQRRDLGAQVRDTVRQLTPVERRELDKERREQLRKYFSLAKKDKIAYLDKQIQRMEAARRQWQAQANMNQRSNNANFGPRMRTLDSEERDKRRRERLDFSTAEDRADRAQFRKDLEQRRAQLGLTPMAGPWGRRVRTYQRA
jgi:hypothetical protein